MRIVVDTREQSDLVSRLQGAIVRQLDLGDIVIEEDDDEIRAVIERKTEADLVASICDGRYQSQRDRLVRFRNDHPDVFVAYVVENYPTARAANAVAMVVGAKASLQVRDRIPVHTSRGIADTVAWIHAVVRRLASASTTATAPAAQSSLAQYRRSAVDARPEAFLPQALTLVPGVGPVTAARLAGQYSSMLELVLAVEADEADDVPDAVKRHLRGADRNAES